jgi:hypothetical protein
LKDSTELQHYVIEKLVNHGQASNSHWKTVAIFLTEEHAHKEYVRLESQWPPKALHRLVTWIS